MSSSPLRAAIESAKVEHRLSLADLTVMSPQKDPYRLDTPANHRDGKWLADVAATLGLGDRRIHNRGLHYMVLGQTMPNGEMYVSNDDCWTFLENASKYARWLGYIPFDQIIDQRNAPPVVRIFEEPDPWPYITVGIDVDLPDAADIIPKLAVDDFVGVQPYKLVMVGEKSSLEPVLGPIANSFAADLYLPTGDISDTMVYQMARVGAEDGRPMVVLYFADADPSGWNMGVVVSRKLQAFKEMHFPELDVEVHRVALTVEQVKEFRLPSTPLKETERRADKWRAAMGVEQTEVDALATLRPDLLASVTREAIAPFYDLDLDRRVARAKSDWMERALAVINDNLDGARLARIRADAEIKLAEMREQIATLNEALRIDVRDFDLPEIVVPGARPTLGLQPEPLFDSGWSFLDATRRLLQSKAYEVGGGT